MYPAWQERVVIALNEAKEIIEAKDANRISTITLIDDLLEEYNDIQDNHLRFINS